MGANGVKQSSTSVAVGVGLGLLFAGLGVMIYAMVRMDPGAARAPLFVIDAAAGCFFFAGISVVARALNAPLIGKICALPVVYLLAVPGLWLLFGDAGECSVSGGVSGPAVSGTAPSGACQIVFGGGAVIVLVFAVAMTMMTLRGKAPAEADARPEPAERPVSDQR
jgi:hypothetical protein